MAKQFGREFKFSNFHNFFLEAKYNPYTFLNLRHLYLGLKTRKRIFMYAIFIRFMFGCKHSTKGVIEFRIMAMGMHIVHSETFMSKLVASYFGETFSFLPMPSEWDILLDLTIQRFIQDKLFDSKFENHVRKNLITTMIFYQELILISLSKTS